MGGWGGPSLVIVMFLPPPGNPNAKIGFSTYAMWALCFVVVGVCYKVEQNELAAQPAWRKNVPDDVQKVLPSGMWLMSAPIRLVFICAPANIHVCLSSRRRRLHSERQLRPSPRSGCGSTIQVSTPSRPELPPTTRAYVVRCWSVEERGNE